MKDKKESSLNILVSYAYLDKSITKHLLKVKQDRPVRFYLDSGAFTAWKTGKEISIKEYIAYLKNPALPVERYFMLDAIGNPKKTFDNYKRMLDAGLNPVPVFTRGAPFDDIHRYYETTDLIAMGGLQGLQFIKGYIKRCMREIAGRKIHWLAFTNLDFIKHYQPFSCDSSSWSMAARYARIQLCRKNGGMIILTKENFLQRPNSDIQKLLAEYGASYREFMVESGWRKDPGYHSVISAMSYVRLALLVQKHLGTNMYLVVIADHQIGQIAGGYDYWVKEGGKLDESSGDVFRWYRQYCGGKGAFK